MLLPQEFVNQQLLSVQEFAFSCTKYLTQPIRLRILQPFFSKWTRKHLIFGNVEHSPVRLAICDIDSISTRVLNDKLLQIFIELPKSADSVEELREDSCFLDKFAVVMKRMAECETPPEIFGEGIFRRLFDAADLNGFNAQDKGQYKPAVMNELDYEATLYDYEERGRKEGEKEGEQKQL